MTLLEASEVLGISKEGVRKRVLRGTLAHDKDADGVVHVYLTGTDGADARGDAVGDGYVDLIDALQDRIDSLERQLEIRVEELRRKDTVIMALTQRVPELTASEAPQDTLRDAPHGQRTAADEDGGRTGLRDERGEQNGAQDGSHRSWWRRVFGG